MRNLILLVFFAVVFFSLSTLSWAVDHKNWVPLGSDTLGGLKASSSSNDDYYVVKHLNVKKDL